MPYEFTIIIERDPESGWLIGSVAELPGCYSQAPNLAALESNMREAVRVYLETLEEREPPDSAYVRLRTRPARS